MVCLSVMSVLRKLSVMSMLWYWWCGNCMCSIVGRMIGEGDVDD